MTTTDELASLWETTSGLPLDGATVTITGSSFGFNAQIGTGVTCWNAEFTNDADEMAEQSFSIGAQGGEPSRDGSELVNGSKSFSKRSNYGRMLDAAVECIGSREKCAEVVGDPRIAENWLGTKWTLGTIPGSGRVNPQTKEKVEKDVLVFVEFHGKEGDDKPAKAKGTTKKVSSAKASKAAATPDIDEELWTELCELAKEHEDHEDFMEAALAIEGVDESKAAQKAVMSTRDGSVWKEVHG